MQIIMFVIKITILKSAFSNAKTGPQNPLNPVGTIMAQSLRIRPQNMLEEAHQGL